MKRNQKSDQSKKSTQNLLSIENISLNADEVFAAEKRGAIIALTTLLTSLREEKISSESSNASYSDYYLGRIRGRNSVICAIENMIKEMS